MRSRAELIGRFMWSATISDIFRHMPAASALAEAIRDEKPDLVLTGLQSDDYGYGQTGVILAELLGLPHATIVIEVDASGEQVARQTRTRKRLVSVVHDADTGAADDSVGH